MESQQFLHNSTRQETVDNPPRWATGRRSSVTCSDVIESSRFTPESNSIRTPNIQTDVPAKYVARRPMDQNSTTNIQKDERRNITQRPMDSGVNVLSFLSNVQPRHILSTLQMVLRHHKIYFYQTSTHHKMFSGLKPSFTAFQISMLLLAMKMMKPTIILIR